MLFSRSSTPVWRWRWEKVRWLCCQLLSARSILGRAGFFHAQRQGQRSAPRVRVRANDDARSRREPSDGSLPVSTPLFAVLLLGSAPPQATAAWRAVAPGVDYAAITPDAK